MFKEQEKFDQNWFIHSDLRLGESTIPGAGTGVFATADIPARTVIESCPVIIMAHNTFNELNSIHPGVRHILSDYPFQWTNGRSAICLGWGGIINHSFEPNAQWRLRTKEEHGFDALVFRLKRNIKAGEEIFVRYVWDADKLWFVDEDAGDAPQTVTSQIQQYGTMGMQAQGFFNDVRRLQGVSKRGHNIETLGDWQLVTKKKKTED